MKRRAVVKISPKLLKEILMLPGEIADVQIIPSYHDRYGKEPDYRVTEADHIAIKLANDDLPEVPEGGVIPIIDVVITTAKDPFHPRPVRNSYWKIREDGQALEEVEAWEKVQSSYEVIESEEQ